MKGLSLSHKTHKKNQRIKSKQSLFMLENNIYNEVVTDINLIDHFCWIPSETVILQK